MNRRTLLSSSILALLGISLGAGCAPSSMESSTQVGKRSSESLRDLPIPEGALFAPDRVIVGFENMESPDSLEHASLSLRRMKSLSISGAALYELPPGQDLRELIDELRASGRFTYVEPDYERNIQVNDPYRANQWNLNKVEAELAWSLSTGTGITVAVIDTGVSSGPGDGVHGLLSGWDFVNEDSSAADDNAHGTHVAGTIAQNANNARGVAGLAYNASILPIKVLNAKGSGMSSDVIQGIELAVEEGAQVINLSLGSTSGSAAEAEAVQAAWDAGVFVAAATGNSNVEGVYFPAACSGAVAVGATDFDEDRAPYSNWGPEIDLMAPGGNTSENHFDWRYVDGILQETFEGSVWGYHFYQGTSMATPHVAASAALLMADGASAEEALSYLQDSAMDLGDPGWDPIFGWGRIQTGQALVELANRPVPDTEPPIISEVSDQKSRRKYTVTWITDEPATSQVCNESFERCTVMDETLVSSHSVTLSAPDRGTYFVVSADELGNSISAGPFTY